MVPLNRFGVSFRKLAGSLLTEHIMGGMGAVSKFHLVLKRNYFVYELQQTLTHSRSEREREREREKERERCRSERKEGGVRVRCRTFQSDKAAPTPTPHLPPCHPFARNDHFDHL